MPSKTKQFLSCIALVGASLGFLLNPVTPRANSTTSAGTLDMTLNTEVDRIYALSDDVAYGEYIASECATCHSRAPVPGSTVPVLYGLPSLYIIQALLEYREGVRHNTTMGGVADGLGDEEIAVLAHYFATKN